MIRARIARKSFGRHEVLGRIDLDVAQGERVALVGPSGIGKTTLLRIASGLETDFEGEVERPERIAMVFQEPTLLPWRSALANITLVTRATQAMALRHLAEVGLEEKVEQFPGQLSLGQQRRLALARAFAASPDLLVMDEPFVSLDEALADEIIGLTRALIDRHRTTVLLVTHARSEAQRLTDRILALKGSPARLAEA